MSSESDEKSEIRLVGVAAAPGVACGPAFVFLQDDVDVPCYPVDPAGRAEELRRFEEAMAATRVQIARLRGEVSTRLGDSEAAIFDAHLLVLEDPALMQDTVKELDRSGYNIEHCFSTVARRYVDFFSAMDDDYLKERVSDIRDVTERILHNLLGLARRTFSEVTEQRVVVSEDLTPSDTASMEAGNVLAIVTDGGNRTSHAVIMARSLRVPAVVALRHATAQIKHDDLVLVDGFEGIVYLNPSRETLERYGQLKVQRGRFEESVRAEIDRADVTEDGSTFTLCANVGGPEDIDDVRRFNGRGVGLYRSESLFLKEAKFPSEEEQFQAYRRVVESLNPGLVVIRTLDIGGDKQMPSQAAEGEANPFMGFRAIRFCLGHPEIFKVQLRAILRASVYGRTAVMFPMVATLSELRQARAIFEEVCEDLTRDGLGYDRAIKVGVMIEIPSAALWADAMARHCDFFSIGTNDLVQYLLAVDRGNERIAHLYNPCHPVVSRVIRDVVDAAHRNGIPVSVCGEMAGDPLYAPLLLGLGVDSLSMTSASIPVIRYLLRHSRADEIRALAAAVLADEEPRSIATRLREYATQRLGPLLQR